LGKGEVFDILVRGLVPGGLILLIGGLEGLSDIVKLGSTDKVEADKYTFQGWNCSAWFQSLSPEEKQKEFVVHSDRLKKELSTQVSKTFHLKDIKQALEASTKNQTQGKIMLIP